MKVGIIVPCHNEEKRLNVEAFRKCLRDYNDFHLCFVNDGSKDNTLDLLYDFKRECEDRVDIINMKKSVGKAMAIRAGARYYYNIPTIEYVGYLEADLSDDYDDYDGLEKNLKQNRKLKMTFGARRKSGYTKKEIIDKIISLINSFGIRTKTFNDDKDFYAMVSKMIVSNN